MTEADQVFKEHKIVADIIPTPPKQFLKITYRNGHEVHKGNELTPTQVKSAPHIEWDSETDAFYALILTDPDAPSRKNPQFREYQHWIVGNIPGSDILKGEVITAYVGASPPEGTGLHRYIFLLYKQPKKLQFAEIRITKASGSSRGKFSTTKFVKKYNMGEPLAGNFFQAQWEK